MREKFKYLLFETVRLKNLKKNYNLKTAASI